MASPLTLEKLKQANALFAEAEAKREPAIPAFREYSLLNSDDPILRQAARPVVFEDEAEVKRVSTVMGMMLVHNPNILGMAAPQIGVLLRFFISKLEGLELVINPEILWSSKEHTSRAEGCISFSGGNRKTFVRRPDLIKATWINCHGDRETRMLSGLDGRLFQHERDHLDGICIFP